MFHVLKLKIDKFFSRENSSSHSRKQQIKNNQISAGRDVNIFNGDVNDTKADEKLKIVFDEINSCLCIVEKIFKNLSQEFPDKVIHLRDRSRFFFLLEKVPYAHMPTINCLKRVMGRDPKSIIDLPLPSALLDECDRLKSKIFQLSDLINAIQLGAENPAYTQKILNFCYDFKKSYEKLIPTSKQLSANEPFGYLLDMAYDGLIKLQEF